MDGVLKPPTYILYILYRILCTLRTLWCTLHSTYSIVYYALYVLYDVLCTLHTLLYTMHSMYFMMYSALYILYCILFTLCTLWCTLFSTYSIIYYALYVLNDVLCTLHTLSHILQANLDNLGLECPHYANWGMSLECIRLGFVTPWLGSNPGPLEWESRALPIEPLVTGKSLCQVTLLYPGGSYCNTGCNRRSPCDSALVHTVFTLAQSGPHGRGLEATFAGLYVTFYKPI